MIIVFIVLNSPNLWSPNSSWAPGLPAENPDPDPPDPPDPLDQDPLC